MKTLFVVERGGCGDLGFSHTHLSSNDLYTEKVCKKLHATTD